MSEESWLNERKESPIQSLVMKKFNTMSISKLTKDFRTKCKLFEAEKKQGQARWSGKLGTMRKSCSLPDQLYS